MHRNRIRFRCDTEKSPKDVHQTRTCRRCDRYFARAEVGCFLVAVFVKIRGVRRECLRILTNPATLRSGSLKCTSLQNSQLAPKRHLTDSGTEGVGTGVIVSGLLKNLRSVRQGRSCGIKQLCVNCSTFLEHVSVEGSERLQLRFHIVRSEI